MSAEEITFIVLGASLGLSGYLFTVAIDRKRPIYPPARLIREWAVLLIVLLGVIIIRLYAPAPETAEAAKNLHNSDLAMMSFLVVHIYTRIKRIQKFRKDLHYWGNGGS